MKIHLWLNGKEISDDISPDMPLLEYVRTKGCYSVKRGCVKRFCRVQSRPAPIWERSVPRCRPL